MLSDNERRRHIYLIGKTGTGKSSLLHNMMMADFHAGRGFAFLDPHGTGAEQIINATPTTRTNDVLYLDPLDPSHVVGFNPLIRVPPLDRAALADNIAALLKYIWADSWGVRLNYILTNALRLLLEKRGTTLVNLSRVLIDEEYRKRLLTHCTDGAITTYWKTEFMSYSPSYRAEAIGAVQNKVGQFQNNPILRAVFGQVSGAIHPYDIMEHRRVLIADLSKRMGEEPSRILGSLLTTAFSQAAERRRTIAEEKRQDFTLYLDEFQSFTSESMGTILSEARKWRLNLVLSHQFMDQIPESIQRAVIGNCGTLIVFRVGSFDTPILGKELGLPNPSTLSDTSNFQAWVKHLASDTPSEALPVTMLPPQVPPEPRRGAVVARSRARHAKKRDDIERTLAPQLAYQLKKPKPKNKATSREW